jgi:ABC-type branched-subunit amino acid transport system ATPase component
MLELDGASKWFGALAALDGCSFVARPGRSTGFLGPNGAGKSGGRSPLLLAVVAVAVGGGVVVLAGDVVIGVAAGAAAFALARHGMRVWGRRDPTRRSEGGSP